MRTSSDRGGFEVVGNVDEAIAETMFPTNSKHLNFKEIEKKGNEQDAGRNHK